MWKSFVSGLHEDRSEIVFSPAALTQTSPTMDASTCCEIAKASCPDQKNVSGRILRRWIPTRCSFSERYCGAIGISPIA